jgi:hypothetical protein
MKYELAQKLKDAGWPQENPHWFWIKTSGMPYHHLSYPQGCEPMSAHDDSSIVASPSLSELIDACQKSAWQFSLYGRDQDRWEATSVGALQPLGGMLDPNTTAYGNTPEEAVANLWLSLNQK